MSDFRYIPRSALVGPSASGRIPEHWLKGQMPGRRDSFDHVPLAQFVLLSMLLHALAITLFGAPTGGSREGRAMWSSLNVLLMGPMREEVSPPVPEPLPRVLPAPPKPRPVPKPPPPAPPPETPPEALPVEAAPTQAPLSFPPLLDRIQTPETTAIPELKVPLPLEAPVSIPSPIERMEAPAPKLEMAPAVELPPMREPPPVPAPLPLPAPVPAPPPPVPPPVERAPVVETPVLPSPPPPVVTPPVERAPIEVPPLPVPAPANIAPPPLPVEKVQPAETAVVPATPPPAIERLEPPAPIREVPVKRESELPPKIEATPRFTAPLPGPSESPFRSAPKKPDASTDYDPTAPSIDMDAVRKRAGAIAREGTGNRALLPFPMPPKPEHKTKEQIAIENARKPDCRSAYASLGLAAIIPLIANEFGEGSCRW